MTEMNRSVTAAHIMVHVHHIYGEYLEMPGLRLTSAQAQRLLGIEAAVCTNALDVLVNTGFLRLTPMGQYVRVTDGVVVPPFRMTKASFVQGRTDQKAC
jgi:hypothetical protein